MSKLLEKSISYKPFHYEWCMHIAEEHEKGHWIHQEVDLSGDVKDWHSNLDDGEKNQFHLIIKSFTQADAQVGENYIDNLLPIFKNNEVRNMLLSFAAREGIHQRAYAAIVETLNLPDSDFEEFLQYEEMKSKIDFWKDGNDTRSNSGKGLAVAKNIFAEGVSLFGSFTMLLNFQRNGKMLGTNEINRFSILEEHTHCDSLIRLFREFCNDYPKIVNDVFKKSIYDYARITYQLESNFIDLAYSKGYAKGLTKTEVKEYIKYLIDRRLISMGLKGIFEVKINPLPWIDELLGTPVHENFFECSVTEYTKGGMIDSWNNAW